MPLHNPTAVAAIQAVTDLLPDAGALTSISAETDKIDNAVVDGLLGVANSLAYKVTEIERHLHSGARWFEEAGTPTAAHKADRIGTVGGAGAFRIDAGNDTWGDWVQIFGSDDTPTVEGKAYFDPHQIIVEDVEKAVTYFIQIGRGASGDAALTAGTYSEFIYAATNTKDSGIIVVQTGRAPAGSLLWARCMVSDEDTAWLDFYIGIHEYEG
jgi:hypothetical protein